MKMIIRLLFLALGFLGGVAFSVKFPDKAMNLDKIRAEEQAKLQAQIGPKLQEAAANAKIEVLGKVLGDSPAAPAGRSFVGGGTSSGLSSDKRADLQQELEQAKKQLQEARTEMKQ